ncbi:MAG: phosphatidylglycerol lysyltransferase, partial [Treponema sp.]|nr:phosphatidylglycerol lysyltransferase [Treponema sp.]
MTVQDGEQALPDVRNALSGMILSHSGWRGVFAASGGEEDGTAEIGPGHRIVAAGAAVAFAEYLRKPENGAGGPVVLIGTDTRPTGRAIADVMIPALLASGCRVRCAGFVAAPEIMAWARSGGSGGHGFVYVSASHNPIGHNGLKFGLTDGGVLPAWEAEKLAEGFRSLMSDPGGPARLERLLAAADPSAVKEVLAAEHSAKREALAAYSGFAAEVAWGTRCLPAGRPETET